MPIKPENRALYPANWKSEIRPSILERAGHKCEVCGISNHAVVLRAGDVWVCEDGATHCAQTGALKGYTRGADLPEGRMVRIVLTIAHLDHDPTNNDPENLRAMCQRHHLAHDLHHHKANAAATHRAKKASADLFAGDPRCLTPQTCRPSRPSRAGMG